MGQKPNEFMVRMVFEKIILNIDYTTLYLLNIMDPPANID